MSERLDLIAELEASVSQSNIARRADVLRKITDLFVAGSGHFSKEHLDLFDEMMGLIICQVTVAARSRLAADLSSMSDAPRQAVRALALDDSIEVARPILEKSAALEDTVLLETGSTKSQQHLLAISRRQSLSTAVTDLLLERGDQEVVLSTASNLGAEFSDSGYSVLVDRSRNDLELAMRVWLRPEIPRRHLLQLLSEASGAVREHLEGANRNNLKLMRNMALRAADLLQTETRERSEEFRRARNRVEKCHANGELCEDLISQFAKDDAFDEVVVALSLLARLPVAVIERSLIDPQSEHLLVIAKAIGLSWQTTELLFRLRGPVSLQELDHFRHGYWKLQPKTAKTALDFYRLRDASTKA